MSFLFKPHFVGAYKPETIADGFLDRLAERVKSGLFPLASPRRNNYRLVNQAATSLRFQSVGLLTSWNVGLNDVRIEINRQAREIRYEVRFGKWSRISAVFGCILFLCLLVGYRFLPADYFPPQPFENLLWPFVGFWCFVWPWILTAMHKRPAAKCLTRILEEVNRDST